MLVLWLAEEPFSRHPLKLLARLLADLRADTAGVTTRVIGPRLSGTLRFMAADARQHGYLDENDLKILRRASFYAATATMEDDLILNGICPASTTIGQCLEGVVNRGGLAGFHFVRIARTDRSLAGALIEELGLRDVRVGTDHIALIGEWDTFYSRALPYTFVSRATGTPVATLLASSRPWPPWLHRFTYLRGIDGSTATNPGAAGGAAPGAGAGAAAHADKSAGGAGRTTARTPKGPTVPTPSCASPGTWRRWTGT